MRITDFFKVAARNRESVAPLSVHLVPDEQAMSLLSISTPTANLLVVGLDGSRHSVMDDIPDIWLVDTHAKGLGADHKWHLIVDEGVCRLLFLPIPLLLTETKALGRVFLNR